MDESPSPIVVMHLPEATVLRVRVQRLVESPQLDALKEAAFRLIEAGAQRVIVLHQGTIAEAGEVAQVLGAPQQPYTRQLIADTPSLEVAAAEVGIAEPPAGAADLGDLGAPA